MIVVLSLIVAAVYWLLNSEPVEEVDYRNDYEKCEDERDYYSLKGYDVDCDDEGNLVRSY